MSKILENKQMIHIAAEVIVILGITFYFSQKNKKIMNHINDLSQRLEDQEDVIQKYEQIITTLSKKIEEHEQKLLFIQNLNQTQRSQAPKSEQIPVQIPVQQKNIPIPILSHDKKNTKKTKNTKVSSKENISQEINNFESENKHDKHDDHNDIHVIRRTINIEKTVPFHTIIVGNAPNSHKNLHTDSKVEEIFEEEKVEEDVEEDDEDDEEVEEELLDAELEEEFKDLN